MITTKHKIKREAQDKTDGQTGWFDTNFSWTSAQEAKGQQKGVITALDSDEQRE